MQETYNLTTSSLCSFKATNVTSCEHFHVLLHLGVQTHRPNTSKKKMLQIIDSQVKQKHMQKQVDDSFTKIAIISHLMKQFVNISLSYLETKSTLPSRYDMHVTHNQRTQVNYSCMFKHNKTIKIPLFIHTNSHACIQFFNSLTSTIISTRTPFICTCT